MRCAKEVRSAVDWSVTSLPSLNEITCVERANPCAHEILAACICLRRRSTLSKPSGAWTSTSVLTGYPTPLPGRDTRSAGGMEEQLMSCHLDHVPVRECASMSH